MVLCRYLCISIAGRMKCNGFIQGEGLFLELQRKAHSLCMLADTSLLKDT